MNNPIKKAFPRQQRGVAAIMFVIMLPVLMGFISLGIEGGHYLAYQGQLRNAAEVASLAISARGIASDNERKELSNEALAKSVIISMIPDIEIENLKVTVTRKECLANGDCSGAEDGRRFYQYQVNTDSTQNSWFPGWTGDGMGFPDKITMSTNVTSRKYYGSGVDVVFVADFSGSMNDE